MAISRFQSLFQRLFSGAPAFYRPIAPLAVLRIAFGAIVLFSCIRFLLKGWVTEFYVQPSFHFSFYGFEWVHAFGATGMYTLFGVMALAAFCVMTGLFYRIASMVFFLCFTYTELIDQTYYLNHYYLITTIAFLLILVPANAAYSLDVLRKPSLKRTHVPAWTISVFQLQLIIVYFCAGLAKLNGDWLLEALPLRIWLPANAQVPLVGYLLEQEWVAYAFSWFGALFDLTIGLFLSLRRTRPAAYVVVILFHVCTALLFKIGIFPYVMIALTPIFFSAKFHERLLHGVQRFFSWKPAPRVTALAIPARAYGNKGVSAVLILFFVVQITLPFRYLLYPGNLFWTEEGYRFSWRVMLMEKSGTAFFYVTDPATGGRSEIINSQYLNRMQEKMMATQPDMILQYAHHLADVYEQKGIRRPIVTADCYVTLNGSGSRLFIDNRVDLAREQEGFAPKRWILPFEHPNSSK